MFKNALECFDYGENINITIEEILDGNKMVEVIFCGWSFIKIITDESVYKEISDYFTFRIPDWEKLRRMMIKKNPKWYYFDGRVKLFNNKTKKLPLGLLRELYVFCKERKYKIKLPVEIVTEKRGISRQEVDKFISSLNLTIKPYSYQVEGLYQAINNKRVSIVSSTGSGKSAIIAMYAKYCFDNTSGKILIVVPTISLVKQLKKDFETYGIKDPIHEVMAGKPKDGDERIIVSTWQSIYEQEEDYFKKFQTLIIDEIHMLRNKHDGKAVLGIAEKCTRAEYRMGTTGTLRDCQINKLQIVGMFGPVKKITSTKKLMDSGHLSPLKINTLFVDYPYDIKLQLEKLEWDSQQEFIESIENPRQKMICGLASSLKMNTLILFRKITHGTFIYEYLLKNTSKKVHYVDGKITANDREVIRLIANETDGNILVCSYGTFAAGVDIKNLHNVIFASSSKSKIRVMQSIGRTLRKHDSKTHATLYDFVDNFGYFITHYNERKSLYSRENFDVKERNVSLTEWCKKENIDFF